MTGAVVVMFCVGLAVPASASASTTTSAPANISSDRATAQAINLTSTDLPGWQESPNPPNASDQSFNAQMSACAGGPAPNTVDVVDVSSANFDKGPIELNSDVTMVRSHADGMADLRSVESRKALSCLHTVFKRVLASQIPGVKVTNLKASTFRPQQSLSEEFGLQVSLRLSGTENGVKLSVPISVREIGFLVGRAEVTFGENFKGRVEPVSNEAALVNTLYQRALSQATS